MEDKEMIDCPNCKGDGQVEDKEADTCPYDCRFCYKDSLIECPRCNGKGEIEKGW